MDQKNIRFRAKRTDNGRWTTSRGFLYISDDEIYLGSNCDVMVGSNRKCGDITSIRMLHPGSNDVAFYRIDPKTIGEESGIIDTAGTMIFDGDIVRDRNDVIYEVRRICAAFYLFPQQENTHSFITSCIMDKSLGLKIIGNVYDGVPAGIDSFPTIDDWIRRRMVHPSSGLEPFCSFDGAFCNDAYSEKCLDCEISAKEYERAKHKAEEIA